MSRNTNRSFRLWWFRLVAFAIHEADMVPVLGEPFWRECFDDGMTPEQAFRESFVEQDGL
jgi:hypothetical protein